MNRLDAFHLLIRALFVRKVCARKYNLTFFKTANVFFHVQQKGHNKTRLLSDIVKLVKVRF